MSPADDIRPSPTSPRPSAWGASAQGSAAGAAAVYFGVVLAVASLSAPLRDFFLRSGTDPLLVTLSEATVIAMAMTYGSGWAVRVFDVAQTLPARLAVGAGAMALVCISGLVALLAGGASLSEIGAQAATPAGVIMLLTLGLGVILPLARGRN